MDTERNYANIARKVNGIDDDGQNLQQFMSDSPWEAEPVFQQIQREISQRPELAGGVLVLDESDDERAGSKSVGASRQYLGRLGKVDMGQVGMVLGYYVAGLWIIPEYICPRTGLPSRTVVCIKNFIFPSPVILVPNRNWGWR